MRTLTPLTASLISSLCLLGSLYTSSALATIYKTVDKDGNITFTDQPQGKQAEAIEVSTPNTIEATQSTMEQEETTDNRTEAPSSYMIRILSPDNDSQIPTGQETVSISASLQPALHNSHKLQFLLNGKPFGKPGKATQTTLKNLVRGSQTLSAQALDTRGMVIGRANPVTIHIQRSRLTPQPIKAKPPKTS